MKKYTKKERKAIHSALVAAVPFLWDGKGPVYPGDLFICNAINKDGQPGSELAMDMIDERLAGHLSVRQWLRFECKIPKRQLTHKNVQAYRHRWLAAMIEEFSE